MKRSLALLGISALMVAWLVWNLARPQLAWQTRFDWDEKTGFTAIQTECPPTSSRIARALSDAYCRIIAVQSKRFIVRELRNWGWNRAKGEVPVLTILKPFPLVMGLSRLLPWHVDDPAVTPLMLAAEVSDEARVKELLLAGADVNARDQRGYTPLIHASMALHANPDILRTLILRGADVDARDKSGRNALLWSVFNTPRPEIVRTLVEGHANVNVRDQDGSPVLLNALSSGSDRSVNDAFAAVKILVGAGAKLDMTDSDGETALALAQRMNRTGIAEFLRYSGASN